MDTYVIECSGCWSRFPARYVTQVDGKCYCRQCWRKIARLVRDAGRELPRLTLAEPDEEPKLDAQRERNKRKPDVMDARIPPRKGGPRPLGGG